MHRAQGRRRLVAGFLTVFLLSVGPAWAGKAELRQANTYDRFVEGQLEGVALTPAPALQLAPALEKAASLDVDRIWSLTQGKNGALYAGTGDSGQIWAVDGQGQSRLVFDSPELAIHDLIHGLDGNLYAGTSPDGLVYRIAPDGQATTLVHTQTHYVWDLALGPSGQLYAATGEDGRILAIARGGEAEVLADLPDQHVMALSVAADRLFAATSNKGRIYEIPLPAGPPRLLFEADQEEIHDLVRSPGGALYASGVGDAAAVPGQPRTALYRIDPQGSTRLLWQDDKARIADLLALSDGRLLVASGDPARLYRLEVAGAMSLLANLEESAPNRLLAVADGPVYLGAAQGGQLWRLGQRFGRSGQFESAVEDFQVVARWGRISWRAQTPKNTALSFATRSGNSAEPDETWSPWSDPVPQDGAMTSPPARFLQYRALFTSDDGKASPILHQVDLFGLPANLPPEITDLQTYPYRAGQPTGNGGPEQKGANQALNSGNPRRSPPLRSSLRLVRWQAHDANRDQLSYNLFLRSNDQRDWKLVEEDLPQTSVIWDTATMPEGMTLLKLVASDRSDHPDGTALEDERVTPPFPIDNSPPRLEIEVQGREPLRLKVSIEDRITPILKAQYKVDYGDRAHQLAPVDGLFDSSREEVLFTVADLAPGEHVIVVQAWDQLDNIGAHQIVVQIE